MENMLKKHLHQFNPASEAGSHAPADDNVKSPVSFQPSVELEPIKIPKFHDDDNSWIDHKEASVNENTPIQTVQEYFYSRNCLGTEPIKVIESLQVLGNNHQHAWQLLTGRYDNEKLIIHNHIEAISEHPVLTKESFIELRDLYDRITIHLRALQSLGENTDSWDRLILYLIPNKFDSVIEREWESYGYEENLPTLTILNVFLEHEENRSDHGQA
ncbi:hypothetical protein JTB14_020790 [Gonioctena quinquepunctata]|nr:hypothetical protein JTB14_020790 [Gonioctena quinquepunctata]